LLRSASWAWPGKAAALAALGMEEEASQAFRQVQPNLKSQTIDLLTKKLGALSLKLFLDIIGK
jgi:hypothetical protein